MTIQEFRDYMASGKPVVGGGDVHMMFHQLSQEALKITAEINGKYHTPEQLHDLLEQLWGREVPILKVCAKVAKIPQISVSLPSDLSEFMYY